MWKDKRLLDPQQNVFVKYSENNIEHETEVSVIKYLRKQGIEDIPEIIKTEGLRIYMPNFRGIRVFELLVQLDDIYEKNGNRRAREVKQQIINRCDKRQQLIQKALIEWRKIQKKREAYPQYKLESIIRVLTDCTQIKYDKNRLLQELNYLNEYWESVVDVPFRDATVKNMVFMHDLFNRIEINPTADKTLITRNKIEEMLGDNQIWNITPIVDFDFSSCIHDTTLEDDFISLHYHERTYRGIGYVEAQNLIWNGIPDAKRAAISFLVRYYRFGGRKAAYRLLNPINHMVRFSNDNDCFYYQHLNPIIRSLWNKADDELPFIMELTDKLGKKIGTCMAYKDAFYEQFPSAFREPWAGMYEKPGE